MMAGRRNCRVNIQQNTPTQSASGELVDNWSLYKTVWCSLSAVSGGERYIGRQVHAEANYAMNCLHQDAPLLTEKMRILCGHRQFDILLARNRDERGREWLLDLRERDRG